MLSIQENSKRLREELFPQIETAFLRYRETVRKASQQQEECNPEPESSSKPTPITQPETPTLSTKTSQSLPLAVATTPTPMKTTTTAKPAVAERKAFSSDDFQTQVDAYTIKERLSRFNGARAISSDMYFGRTEEEDLRTIGDEASKLASLASEKAYEVILTQLKDKAVDLYNSMAARFR